jgi:primosomal protein N'
MEKIEVHIKKYMKTNSSVLSITGPNPAPLTKIKNLYRYRILLKADSNLAHPLLNELTKLGETLNKIFLSIDINPTNMF